MQWNKKFCLVEIAATDPDLDKAVSLTRSLDTIVKGSKPPGNKQIMKLVTVSARR